MKDDEIIKALEKMGAENEDNFSNKVLNLIYRQQAEIRSKTEYIQEQRNIIDELKTELESKKTPVFVPLCSMWEMEAKAEAVKEFADRIVERLEEMSVTYCREYGYAEDENVLYLPDAIEIIMKEVRKGV